LWLVGRLVRASRRAAKAATDAVAGIADNVADAARQVSEKL
jgi:hypothetical protein